jgi:hypothetical protein
MCEAKIAKDCHDVECPEHGGLVRCDDDCRALAKPITLEEYKATLEHYKNHKLYYGCSHAR